MPHSNSWFISFTNAEISKFKIAKEDMPGDRFQPRKGQEVYMLRKTQAQEDLTAPKSRPKRKSNHSVSVFVHLLPSTNLSKSK